MTSTVEERQLRWFNELKKKEAIGALLLVCHSRKWATQVAAGRPYDDVDSLLVAADETWMALDPDDWLEDAGLSESDAEKAVANRPAKTLADLPAALRNSLAG